MNGPTLCIVSNFDVSQVSVEMLILTIAPLGTNLLLVLDWAKGWHNHLQILLGAQFVLYIS